MNQAGRVAVGVYNMNQGGRHLFWKRKRERERERERIERERERETVITLISQVLHSLIYVLINAT